MVKVLKVILLGDERVGKTSLLNQYMSSKFSKFYKPTIGADFLTKQITSLDGTDVTMQIWDTPGQERFQSLGVAFYKGSEACVLVYDVTRSDTFEAMERYRTEFITQIRVADPKKFPFIVVGNKTDMAPRQVTREQAKEWCNVNGDVIYIETSCKENTNVVGLFEMIPEIVLSKINGIPLGESSSRFGDQDRLRKDINNASAHRLVASVNFQSIVSLLQRIVSSLWHIVSSPWRIVSSLLGSRSPK